MFIPASFSESTLLFQPVTNLLQCDYECYIILLGPGYGYHACRASCKPVTHMGLSWVNLLLCYLWMALMGSRWIGEFVDALVVRGWMTGRQYDRTVWLFRNMMIGKGRCFIGLIGLCRWLENYDTHNNVYKDFAKQPPSHSSTSLGILCIFLTF